MQKIKVYLEKNQAGLVPVSGSAGAAGLDIISAEDIVLLPGETKLVSTALKMALPRGYEIQIRPRSGLSLKTALRIANSPGTIDSDYRDEIKIICQNHKSFASWKDDLLIQPELLAKLKQMRKISLLDYLTEKNREIERNIDPELVRELTETALFLEDDGLPYGTIRIKRGERFAQMVFASYQMPQFELVEEVAAIGQNREGGFGSTGI